MKNKFISLILSIVLVLTLTGCELFPTNGNNINNNITNNITENTVTVGNISVEDLEDLVVTASAKVNDACIGITRTYATKVSGVTYEQAESTGSGVIYKRITNYNSDNSIKSYTYYVITNRHVAVGDDKTKTYYIYAYLGDEYPEFRMNLLGYDTKVDIACATFETTKYIEPIEFASSKEVKAGSFAFAVGCPEGFDYFNSITFGVISCPLRSLSDDTDGDNVNDFQFEFIQHDVSINPGNSGGGLFNLEGKLIGINTMKLVSSDIDNMGFSIPSDIVKVLVEEYLETGKKIVRPRIGISGYEVKDISDQLILEAGLMQLPNIYNGGARYGFYVTSIVEGGSVSTSSMTEHDILLEVDGIKLYNMSVISSKLNSLVDYKMGDKVLIKYYDRQTNSIIEETITLINE